MPKIPQDIKRNDLPSPPHQDYNILIQTHKHYKIIQHFAIVVFMTVNFRYFYFMMSVMLDDKSTCFPSATTDIDFGSNNFSGLKLDAVSAICRCVFTNRKTLGTCDVSTSNETWLLTKQLTKNENRMTVLFI